MWTTSSIRLQEQFSAELAAVRAKYEPLIVVATVAEQKAIAEVNVEEKSASERLERERERGRPPSKESEDVL